MAHPDPPAVPQVDVRAMPTRTLLRTYSELLDELLRRGVVRSRNAPAGDLAETLVARAYDGVLAPRSEKSWDVRAADGRLLQVKCRLVDGDRRRGQYSVFRSWGFDACVFVLLDQRYEVVQAVEVPMAEARAIASDTQWVNGSRIRVVTPLAALPGAVEVTARVAATLLEIEAPKR